MSQRSKFKKKGDRLIITEFVQRPEPKTIWKLLAEAKDEYGEVVAQHWKEIRNPKWKPAF